jgi:hypothetical protein
VDDLVLPVRAFDFRRHVFVLTFLVAGIDLRMKQDVLAGSEALLQLARLTERDHEAEGLGLRETTDVAPTHEPVVLLPPGAALIGCIGNDARRASLANCKIDYRAGLTRRQHELARHIRSFVISLGRACANVDEVCRHVRREAVLRERQRHRLPIAEAPHAAHPAGGLLQLPELGEAHVPYGPRLLCAKHRLAVRRVAEYFDLVESIVFKLLLDVPRRRQKLLAGPHAMLQRYGVEVSFGRFPRGFCGDLA